MKKKKKMKPILFSTPMVQAILDNRKRMTRRVVIKKYSNTDIIIRNGMPYELQNDTSPNEYNPETKMTKMHVKACVPIKPKYQPGDILYVQETWKVDSVADHLRNMAIDFKALQSGHSQAEVLCTFTPDRYKKFRKYYQKNGWQSPYFMPCEAARIFLRVTNVRVERVQDITKEDALAEGIWPNEQPPETFDRIYSGLMPVHLFGGLWDYLNAKRGYGWDVNPWVWVYEFERVDKPGEECRKTLQNGAIIP
jgi:hypothetical protein